MWDNAVEALAKSCRVIGRFRRQILCYSCRDVDTWSIVDKEHKLLSVILKSLISAFVSERSNLVLVASILYISNARLLSRTHCAFLRLCLLESYMAKQLKPHTSMPKSGAQLVVFGCSAGCGRYDRFACDQSLRHLRGYWRHGQDRAVIRAVISKALRFESVKEDGVSHCSIRYPKPFGGDGYAWGSRGTLTVMPLLLLKGPWQLTPLKPSP